MTSFLSRFTTPLVFASLAFSTSAVAQTVPAASPGARVEQTVGITRFSVDYSSPGVKDRKIWGELVPYEKPWRAGANAPTRLTADQPFTFAKTKIPAGSYSLFTIPAKKSWTVILSSDLAFNQNAHDAKKDIARLVVEPEKMKTSRERLAYIFSDTTDEGTNLDLEWEKVRIRIPLGVDTKAQVQAGIDKAVGDAWRPHFTAARYLLDSNGDMAKALEYVNASVAIKPTWWNTWVKAQILAKSGKKADAVASAEKAKALGKGDSFFEQVFQPQIETALKGWK